MEIATAAGEIYCDKVSYVSLNGNIWLSCEIQPNIMQEMTFRVALLDPKHVKNLPVLEGEQ